MRNLRGITEKLESEKNNLDTLYKQVDNIKEELKKPFLREKELAVKSERLNELNVLLSLDQSNNENVAGIEPDEGNGEIPNEAENQAQNIQEEKLNIINEAKNILGKNTIITNALNNRMYIGLTVTACSDNFIVTNDGALHDLIRISFDGDINKGDEITIEYDKRGYGKVVEIEDEENNMDIDIGEENEY